MVKSARLFLLAALLLSFLSLEAQAARSDAPSPQTVREVLALSSLPVDLALAEQAVHADDQRRVLAGQLASRGLPRVDQAMSAFGQELRWQTLKPSSARAAGLWWFQLDATRFVRGHLQVEGLRKPVLYVDGALLSPGEEGYALDLSNGSHSLWLFHEGAVDRARPTLRWQGRSPQDVVRAHTEPQRRVSAQQLTNAETVGSMVLSPNGQQLALITRWRDELADTSFSRLELHDLEAGTRVQKSLPTAPGAMAWSPDGRMLALQQGNSLWIEDQAAGTARTLLAELEGLASWRWHPDSGSILFLWTRKDDTDFSKARRYSSLEDREGGFRDLRQLYQVDVHSGLIRALTAEARSVSLHDVEGSRVLLSTPVIDYGEPPHYLRRVFELDLDTGDQRELARLRSFNDIAFAEEGYWLLAGPALEIGDGDVTADGLTANNYDTQLYRLAADGTSARSLSRDFDPSLGAMQRLAGGNLLFVATAGEGSTPVLLHADSERLEMLDSGLEVVEAVAASQTWPPRLIVRGSSAIEPQSLRLVDAGTQAPPRVLLDTAERAYADVVLGEVHDWRFTNEAGVEIDGRYYLPPDFDASKRYPLIVYYYGGTTPVSPAFTGRYPFNLWAANGYVIYVLQPRGTIGYGQDFSAHHVNAWGDHAAEDIIEGTKKFVAAHRFVDGERIGNIGASYGGFMTMYLATRTDLFAASISHAGISDLTGYWGDGWWGWSYSGTASRGSFPWNNRELYVEHSPIYSADQVRTPLLLLHGDGDTNVPPGGSRNMFTALKLLGQPVELIEFPGEDHWILDREKRYVWWDTMLAWYDKWLKDEPQWWDFLYD